jgi:D-amino-acid dehydrogenase
MEAGLRCAGLVEFGGLDAPASKAPVGLFKRRIRKLYPTLTWESEDAWMGHRPSTIDSLPLIGPSPKAPGVVFAFGAQHLGLTMGPKTGRLIADLIGDRSPNIDMTPYNVGRFDN